MIIAKITQNDLELTIQEINIPYQYSQGLEIEFIRDQKYKDYTLLAFYKLEGDMEAKLMEGNNDIISIAKDVFKKIGKVSFSFSFTMGEEVIHLGVVEFYIRRAFGSDESILPQEDKNTWMDLIGNVAKDRVDNYWNTFYKEHINSIVRDINGKVSDASNYADQANTAKVEASKSAQNASNSATSALNSSNKAKEHLDSIVEKTDTFNANYTEKVNSFNSNVESANNTLDAKIENANTDIDKKITDTNSVLDKKIAYANTSIDGKVQVATEQANIATSKATELKDAVDKVKHLEDVVDTKLTQPYVSSPLIENATISDSDEGQLRNLKIYGKCTQKVETDIVPTPEREVPIVSKKINVNGEVVELRSLKESVNLFDLASQSKVDLLPNNGYYRYIDIPLRLKSNAQYTYSFDESIIPANVRLRLEIRTTENNTLITTICDFQNQANDTQLIVPYRKNTFSLNNENKIVFSAYIEKTINGQNTPNNTEVFKENWYTKILNNIMLVEGTTVPSTYVAPTVRDYKVVDHNNKRSYIERNVKNIKLTSANGFYKSGFGGIETTLSDTFLANTDKHANCFCTLFKHDSMNNGLPDANCWRLSQKYLQFNYQGFNEKELWNAWVDTVNLEFQYRLATSITEEIEYLESDTSEFGVSSQDTTSPSPNIKSEIENVDVLNIRACGKNLFNIEEARNLENWVTVGNGYMTLAIPVSKNVILTVSGDNIASTRQYNAYFSNKANGTQFFGGWLYRKDVGASYRTFSNPTDGNFIYLCVSAGYIVDFLEDFKNLQIEEDNTATTYEPYNGVSITHTLAKPLLKVGDIADVINLTDLSRINNCLYEDISNFNIVGGTEYENMKGVYFCIAIPNANNARKALTPVICNTIPSTKDRFNCNGMGINGGENIDINFKDIYITPPYSNAKVKDYLTSINTKIGYVLAEPTTEPLEPELIEKLKTLKTFYPVTHIISNVPIQFDYKLNMPAWHKVVSGQVEDARNIIYNLTVKQNSLEVMQLESTLETQYNMDIMKLGGM